MEEPSPGTLSDAVLCANIGLQGVQDRVGLQEVNDAKVRFPRGYLRTSHEARKLFRFVTRHPLQANLGYAVQGADVFGWLLTRTDISNIAKDMVVKSFLAVVGGIAEAVMTYHYESATGWRQTFATRAEHLEADGIIDRMLREELMWLWDKRCRQHVFEINASEFYEYEEGDYARARAAINGLIRSLARSGGYQLTCRAV